MTAGKKRIPDFQTCPRAVLIISLVTQDVVNGKMLKAGSLCTEIAATPIPQCKGLNRTANQTPAREISLRQVHP